MGLAEGPDGSLYISESVTGRIWRVMFKGDRKNFGSAQLSKMKARENRTYIKNPDPVRDDLTKTSRAGGGQVLYQTYCRVCHQNNGKGDGTRFPPLARSEWVTGDKDRLIRLTLEGLSGPIEVDGKSYNGAMPHFAYLTDPQVTDVLNYIRTAFGNSADSLSAVDVARVREAVKKPQRK
jgi:mono/diheme cytochrome c family protein